jgi:uncharacterized membrane-anchored protein YitT (DUF2179 family)
MDCIYKYLFYFNVLLYIFLSVRANWVKYLIDFFCIYFFSYFQHYRFTKRRKLKRSYSGKSLASPGEQIILK